MITFIGEIIYTFFVARVVMHMVLLKKRKKHEKVKNLLDSVDYLLICVLYYWVSRCRNFRHALWQDPPPRFWILSILINTVRGGLVPPLMVWSVFVRMQTAEIADIFRKQNRIVFTYRSMVLLTCVI